MAAAKAIHRRFRRRGANFPLEQSTDLPVGASRMPLKRRVSARVSYHRWYDALAFASTHRSCRKSLIFGPMLRDDRLITQLGSNHAQAYKTPRQCGDAIDFHQPSGTQRACRDAGHSGACTGHPVRHHSRSGSAAGTGRCSRRGRAEEASPAARSTGRRPAWRA